MKEKISFFPFSIVLVVILFFLSASAVANDRAIDPEDRSGNWSIGFNYNWNQSPYIGETSRTDIMPNFIYMGEDFYLNTNEMGWHAIDNSLWQLDLSTYYLLAGYNDHTFFSDTGETRPEDDPLKGMERSGAFEVRTTLTRKTDWGRLGLGLHHDISHAHDGGGATLSWSKTLRGSGWQVEPWAEANWFSSEKADYYFGVKPEEENADRSAYSLSDTTNVRLGTAFRYSPWKQHHFNLNAGYTHFDSSIKDSPIVDQNGVFNTSASYRYEFGEMSHSDDGAFNFFTNNENPWSLRVAYGCTSDTSLNEILRLGINCEGDGTHLASLFGSRQISETMFTLPIEVWLTSGIVRRFESDYEGNFWEGVLAFKAIFREFPWSKYVETRFGIAEGLSYAQKIPNIETERAEERDRRTSKLLNYLDFSLDVSIGDILQVESAKSLFIGWSVHHRSGIFASSNLYGNVYGGSNVNTVTIEWEFRH